MKIDRSRPVLPVTPVVTAPVRRPAVPADGEESASAPTPRFDRVDISAAGRELAATLGADGAARVARAQQRLADGTYDLPEVQAAAAQRILASGDL